MVSFKAFVAVFLAALEVSSLATVPTSGVEYAVPNSLLKPVQDCTIRTFEEIATVVASCKNITVGPLYVRLNQPLIMNLKPGTTMTFIGEVLFDVKYKWKHIMEITGNNVTIVGTSAHQIHGSGQKFWDGKGSGGIPKPVVLRLKLQNSSVKGLRLKNCPLNCVVVEGSNNVVLSNFLIDNQDGSPGKATPGKEGLNTDGFKIAKSQYVTIQNSKVYNQDRCVVITSGAHMLIDNVNCYGSHGFSIASGMSKTDQSQNIVKNITFQNSKLYNGTYGLHILTYNDGGKGYVRDITYNNIMFSDASDFGIMIQQDFSSAKQGSTYNPSDNVPIINVKYNGIKGTMNAASKYSYALSVRCAARACSGINLNSVKINNAKSPNECMNYKISGWC